MLDVLDDYVPEPVVYPEDAFGGVPQPDGTRWQAAPGTGVWISFDGVWSREH